MGRGACTRVWVQDCPSCQPDAPAPVPHPLQQPCTCVSLCLCSAALGSSSKWGQTCLSSEPRVTHRLIHPVADVTTLCLYRVSETPPSEWAALISSSVGGRLALSASPLLCTVLLRMRACTHVPEALLSRLLGSCPEVHAYFSGKVTSHMLYLNP